MARDLDADTAAVVQEEVLAPIALVELEFDSETMFLWSGIGDLAWNGNTYTGTGTLGKISAVEETSEIRAVSVQLELSGVPAEVLEIANEESWQGRPVRIYFGVLDGRAFVGEPVQIFGGLMDQMTLTEGSTASVTLSCESQQIDLERTRARRYTAEDQRAEYPGDKGCDAVAALQELDLHWGRS